MKIKSILLSMFAVAALASCSTSPNAEGGGPVTGPTEAVDGYMTLSVVTPTIDRSRVPGSTEDVGRDVEGTISKLYAITFNGSKKVVAATGEDAANSLTISGSGITPNKPKAIKVTSASKYLLIIANPGPKLQAVIDGISTGDSWADINAAISNPLSDPTTELTDKLVDEIRTIAGSKNVVSPNVSYFTMINSGGIDDINDGLIVIAPGKIKNPDDYSSQTEVEDAANADRQEVMIERLTAKVEVTIPSNPTLVEVITGKTPAFTFEKWTLDVLNSTFFPYAVKKQTSTGGHTSGQYTNNFYTIDPNFTDDASTAADEAIAGLYYNQKNGRVPFVTWMDNERYDYAIENTMLAREQQYKNATRIVLRAKYWPDESWTGDWFAHTVSGVTTSYKDWADLKAAYDAAAAKVLLGTPDGAEIALKEAGDKFYQNIIDENPAFANPNGFTDLTTGQLGSITNGGELMKDNNCIKWYQGGLNYYYYEIRHDNTITANMAFGRYGIVRNNWYKLTLEKVNGPGKPWYPTVDPKDPDPDGPEPPDPIDEFEGLLNFDIKVAPWISWSTGFDIG